mmetsp:Transcript_15400/g.43069  ORF Transcript_15400/g.43069 Transcript_15400/m.43069 type:complete len:226 (+) Transcript_15400:120-797(+)
MPEPWASPKRLQVGSGGDKVHLECLRQEVPSSSPRGLVAPDLLQQSLGVLVILKVVPDRLDDGVDGLGQRCLEVPGVQRTGLVVCLQLLQRAVDLVATIGLRPLHSKAAKPREGDVLDVLVAGVALNLLRRAEGLLQLGLHLLLAVLHEDCRVGVALRHLLLPLQQPGHHAVRQDDRLAALGLAVVTVLAGQHVDLALVHPQLADVGLQEEDVSTLHARVEDLCS